MRRSVSLIATIIFAVFPLFAQADKKTDAKADQPGLNPGVEPTKETTAPADTGAPQSGIWKSPAGDNYGTNRTRFSIPATDNLTGVDYIEYRVNDNEFRRYIAPFQLDKEGTYALIFRAVDKAGNKEVDQSYQVTIDLKAPDVAVLPEKPFVVRNGRNYSSPNNSFSMRISDDFSGVRSVSYGVSSDEMKPYADEVIKLTSPGTQLIQYKAEDNVGNKTAGSVLIDVDASKPTVEVVPSLPLTPVGDKTYAKRRTGFKVEGNDTGSGIEQVLVRVDGAQQWQTYSGMLFFDTEKEHTIEAKVIDAVGNESDPKKIVFTVDDNPPTTDLKTNVE